MIFMSSDYTAHDSGKYYETQYASTKVDTSHKSEYVVKKGDSLWNIAKKHLNDNDATNAEIQEMMYKIAKLNKKESLAAINDIQVADVLYLPEVEPEGKGDICYVGDWFHNGASAKKSQAASTPLKPEKSGAELTAETSAKIKKIIEPQQVGATYAQVQIHRLKYLNKIPDELYAEHGKAGIKYWTEVLSGKQDKSIIIEKSYSSSPTIPTALHIIKKTSANPYSPTEAHLYVQADENGNFKRVAFDSPGVDMNSISFDYQLEKNGDLSKPHGSAASRKTLDILPKNEYNAMINVLQEYLDRELAAYYKK